MAPREGEESELFPYLSFFAFKTRGKTDDFRYFTALRTESCTLARSLRAKEKAPDITRRPTKEATTTARMLLTKMLSVKRANGQLERLTNHSPPCSCFCLWEIIFLQNYSIFLKVYLGRDPTLS